MPDLLALERLRQEDCPKLEAIIELHSKILSQIYVGSGSSKQVVTSLR